ncbi:MAG: hypothetical protein ACKVS6_13485 [Planctomycetota bacterium]
MPQGSQLLDLILKKTAILQKTAVVAGAGILLFACRASSYESEGDDHMRAAHFSEALASYRMAEASGGKGDKQLSAKLREAYIAAQLEAGSRLLFDSEFEKSYELFRLLAAAEPDNAIVTKWLKKSEDNLSRKLTVDGKEKMGVREYEPAVKLFERALKYNPDNSDAAEALVRAKTIIKWRADKGELLWKAGMRAISDGQPAIAAANLSAVGDYTHAHPEANEYVSEVRTLVGDQHFGIATNLEKDGQFFAALRQYNKSKTMRATPAGIDDAIARVKDEVRADQLYYSAKGALARQEFDKASDRLQKALELTDRPENIIAIEAKIAEVNEGRNEYEYKTAVDIEQEGRFGDAIVAFTKLDARVPAFNDTRERIDRLTRQIRDSSKNYEEALERLKTNDLLGARSKLKAALFLQPFMAEARAKLKEVEALIAASK